MRYKESIVKYFGFSINPFLAFKEQYILFVRY